MFLHTRAPTQPAPIKGINEVLFPMNVFISRIVTVLCFHLTFLACDLDRAQQCCGSSETADVPVSKNALLAS